MNFGIPNRLSAKKFYISRREPFIKDVRNQGGGSLQGADT